MRYLLVVVLILQVASLFALDLEVFGKAESRLRYEMDTQTNNTSDASSAIKEKKYTDLSFLYGGFIGANANFTKELKASLTVAVDGINNMVTTPNVASFTADQAAVYYSDDKWMIGMGRYYEKDSPAKSLHYYPTAAVDTKFENEHRAFMTGFTPGFRISPDITFRVLTDVIYNTHGSETTTKGGTKTTNPDKDQWMVGADIPMKLSDAINLEPLFLYSFEGITDTTDTIGTSHYYLPPRMTFGADISLKLTDMIGFFVGGGYTMASIDKKADSSKGLIKTYYEDSGFTAHTMLSFKDIGVGNINLYFDYLSLTIKKNPDVSSDYDKTINTMFIRAEYPMKLASDGAKMIYLNPRVKVWMSKWDPNKTVTLDQDQKIRPELILGAKF